ncbi:type VII secretion protein EccB [Nocardioides ferulae]|uniref:type VII secretion protein EccB n=1 Tax=Nocardioides ferulae TaxID=2340821 RepID=UPI000EABC5F2|nr:type VII secretion protein EccB [Nocardioides ferulae]
MATKKDLVEAYSFSRRRLVTAFVSGAPGGREVEPARPGRSVVGGLALSVLLIAGAAIAGIFTGRPEIDWSQPGMFLSKERGALYVVLPDSDSELRPVINVTSAQLILGAEVTPEIVAQDEIEQQHVGDDIGILGAPADVPSADSLVPSGWTACTSHGKGIAVEIGGSSTVTPVPRGAFTVSVGDDTYVIAQSRSSATEETGAYVYAVPGDQAQRDRVLSSLALPNTSAAMAVPEAWVGLFPRGEAFTLEPFGIGDFGAAVEGPGLPEGAEQGDWFRLDDEDEGGFVLTELGPAPLSGFEFTLYRALAQDKAAELTVSEMSMSQGEIDLDATRWPDHQLVPPSDELCGQLVAEEGAPPRILLATDPEGAVSAVASAAKPNDVSPTVEDGFGAYVHSAAWDAGDGGLPFLLTSKPSRHELVGSGVATQLGYDDVESPVVPDTWIELFPDGVPLSIDAALCPPSASTVTGSSCS